MRQVVHNRRQHCSRVIHHRPNVRVFQRYKLIEPVQCEFGEPVAADACVYHICGYGADRDYGAVLGFGKEAEVGLRS